MPYVACPRCGQRTFSAAYWSNREHCGRCGAELPSPRSAPVEPAQRHALARTLLRERDYRPRPR